MWLIICNSFIFHCVYEFTKIKLNLNSCQLNCFHHLVMEELTKSLLQHQLLELRSNQWILILIKTIIRSSSKRIHLAKYPPLRQLKGPYLRVMPFSDTLPDLDKDLIFMGTIINFNYHLEPHPSNMDLLMLGSMPHKTNQKSMQSPWPFRSSDMSQLITKPTNKPLLQLMTLSKLLMNNLVRAPSSLVPISPLPILPLLKSLLLPSPTTSMNTTEIKTQTF